MDKDTFLAKLCAFVDEFESSRGEIPIGVYVTHLDDNSESIYEWNGREFVSTDKIEVKIKATGL